MARFALLTSDDLESYILDEHYLEKALKEKNHEWQWVSWKTKEVDWQSFDCVIVRTTWDYTKELSFFLKQLKTIENQNGFLLNPYSLIQWNSNKRYLLDLEKEGIPVVSTHFYENLAFLENIFDDLDTDKIVVKPSVGAGSKNTFFLDKKSIEFFKEEKSAESRSLSMDSVKQGLGKTTMDWNSVEIMEKVFKNLQNRELMVQPFMKNIVLQGEFSAHFFGRQMSHCILKKPKTGDFRSQEEYGGYIRKVDMTESQMDFCKRVMNQIKGPWLFARIDFVMDNQGQEALMELELIEPSLYFRYAKGSAKLFVESLGSVLKDLSHPLFSGSC